MFRFAFRLIVLTGLIIGSVAVLAAPDETDAVANAGWEEMGVGSASGGGISNSSGNSANPSLGVGFDNAPVVAWGDFSSGNSEIYVRRWNGSAWVEMNGSASGGGISNNGGQSWGPSLAVGPNGAPIVAWYDDNGGNWEIYLRRWNGAAWVELAGSASGGGLSNTSGHSETPALAVDLTGAPIVAWVDYRESGNSEIYVRRWNGAAWVEMGAGSASGGGISNSTRAAKAPSIAVGPDNAPVVAWENYEPGSGRGEIHVRRWSGSAWVEMDGSASGGGISDSDDYWSNSPSVAIGLHGLPIVTWYEWNATSFVRVYLRRWNGLTWVEMNGSDSGHGIGSDSSRSPSVAISPDGAPVIAWEEDSSEIYFRRWNGVAWVEMAIGSASGGGISNTLRGSYSPSLAVGPNGAPVVAWEEGGEIYVRLGPSIQSIYLPASMFAPCFVSPTEIEPNNKATEANGPLCSERVYSAQPHDQLDYFYLETSQAGEIAVDMTNHPYPNVQLLLYYQQPTGMPVARDYTAGDGWHIRYSGPAGRYYIVVYSALPTITTSPYTLQTSFPGAR